MVDEVNFMWGDNPTPTDGRWLSYTPHSIPDNAFTTLMNIINGVSGRSMIGWPAAGGASTVAVQNWQGNPAFSDFDTMYWQNNTLRAAYPWAWSINQNLSDIDAKFTSRRPFMQTMKPMLLLNSAAGPYYTKEGSGDHYIPGQDILQSAGTTPEADAAQAMYAVAKGFAGVRDYAFDTPAQASNRQNASIGSCCQQTFANPTTVGVGRWSAMSNAFNLIKTLEPYIFQAQANAPDLGSTVYTGAKSGASGNLVIAINSLEMPQTVHVDLSPYLYTNSSITRYVLQGATQTSSAISGQSDDTVTLGPGGTVVWLILPM
jgi:hypothetical protein